MEEVMMTKIAWSDEVSEAMQTIFTREETLKCVRRDVETGVSTLWDCKSNEHHAFIISRIDTNPVELVIVGAYGDGLTTFGPFFINHAKSVGIRIRAHVFDEAMARFLHNEFGFVLGEQIMYLEP